MRDEDMVGRVIVTFGVAQVTQQRGAIRHRHRVGGDHLEPMSLPLDKPHRSGEVGPVVAANSQDPYFAIRHQVDREAVRWAGASSGEDHASLGPGEAGCDAGCRWRSGDVDDDVRAPPCRDAEDLGYDIVTITVQKIVSAQSGAGGQPLLVRRATDKGDRASARSSSGDNASEAVCARTEDYDVVIGLGLRDTAYPAQAVRQRCR
jgi:hypothetical protein